MDLSKTEQKKLIGKCFFYKTSWEKRYSRIEYFTKPNQGAVPRGTFIEFYGKGKTLITTIKFNAGIGETFYEEGKQISPALFNKQMKKIQLMK